jgi:hypothetical protein
MLIIDQQPNFVIMDSKLRIYQISKTVILALFIVFVFSVSIKGQLSAGNISEELKVLDKLIREIKWDTYSQYLLYHSMPPSVAEIEDNQNIEIWMVDLGCWDFKESEEMNELLCVQEFEYDYPLENWMLKEFSIDINENQEPEDEENYPVEEWMYDLHSFQNMN